VDTRLGVAAAIGRSHGVISFRREMETFSAGGSMVTISSRSDDPMVLEACGLLDDVRLALDWDLPTASKAAGRLATLLAGKLAQDACSAPDACSALARGEPVRGGLARSGLARGGLAPWQKRMVRKHIDDRLQGSIRVGDLAKLVSLSPSYFSRAFKASFGERPHDYVIRTRIERARTLMLTTSLSLSQIALACGLVDQAHLCRCFRQATGTTPGVWRHNHATGADRPNRA
jgi:AraC family transcriptional regulator